MAIQHRRGSNADFDSTKMLPGELAVTTDGTRKVYAAFAPGDVKELASAEEVQAIVDDFNESIEENIQNATDKIGQKKEEVLAEIPDYKEKLTELETYKANSIITTSSGTVFHETDCAAVPPVNIELFGKSTQKTYPGKNMFNYSKSMHDTSSATTVEVLDNGVIAQGKSDGVKPGQSVASSGWVVLNRKDTDGRIYLEKDMVVTLSMDYTVLENTVETTYDIALLLRCIDDTSLDAYANVGIPNVNVKTRVSCTFTMKQTEYYLPVISLNSCLVKIENVQVEIGDTATEYEPYVGNQPSPNIHYPQKVERHGESGSINNRLLGVNWFNGEIGKWAISTAVIAIGGSFVGFICPIVGGQTYTVSRDSASSSRFAIAYTEVTPAQNVSYIPGTKVQNDTALFLTKEAPIEAKYLVCYLSASSEDVTGTNYQVEIGDTATPIKPYTEQPFTALTPNGLGGIPIEQTIPDVIKNSPIHLAGVYWDNEEGQYYIADYKSSQSKQNVQLIGEDVLTGDEDWKESSNWSNADLDMASYRTSIKASLMSCRNNRNEPVLSTHAVRNENNAYKYGIVACWDNKQVYFLVPKTDFPDVDTFKAHVKAQYDAGTPIKSYYILAEPIITDLTEEELAQYDALVMNYPTTTIVNDAGAYMKVTHVKDTQKHIEQNYTPNSVTRDILTRLSALELNAVNS